MSFIPGIVGGLLGMFGQNQANRSAQQNQQNQYQQSGRDIWNNAQQTEQLLQNLFGGGRIQMPNNQGPSSFGGGIMGNGGQFMQPQGGQQGGQQLPPQIMQMLQQFMQGQGMDPTSMVNNPNLRGSMPGQGNQGGPGMTQPRMLQPQPIAQQPMQPPQGNQPIQGGQNPINFGGGPRRVMY